jgi:hypothetical protein
METGHTGRDATGPVGERSIDRKGYPTNHVIGVINTDEEAARAVQALTVGGFLDSEIDVAAGRAAAEAMHARTGRTGLANLAIRIAERLGIADEEMEVKAHYEQALRDGRFLVRVDAPTEARKELAARILQEHGAHSVAYMGRFAIEGLVPPRDV